MGHKIIDSKLHVPQNFALLYCSVKIFAVLNIGRFQVKRNFRKSVYYGIFTTQE